MDIHIQDDIFAHTYGSAKQLHKHHFSLIKVT